MRFGVSTHLYSGVPLAAEHLDAVAAHGFEAIELFPTRTQLDYRSVAAVELFAQALERNRLVLHSVHAPLHVTAEEGRKGPTLSFASADPDVRQRAMDEAAALVEVARRIPFHFLVVHLGTPDVLAKPGDNDPVAARRSLATLGSLCRPAGIQIALETIANRLSTPAALVELLEEDADLGDVGICLDFGHTRLMGDLVEAIETTSGFVTTTHVHDNRGREDDHLVPFEGTIDWGEALTALCKVGYGGTLLFELASQGAPLDVLRRARDARHRFERLLT